MTEEAYHDVFLFDGYDLRGSDSGIVEVTKANFAAFREIHQTDDATYWNAERIYQTLDAWSIYLLYKNDMVAGAAYARDGEIYGIDYAHGYDEDVYKALVTKILNELKRAGYRHLVFFSDDQTQDAGIELGFQCVGEYVLYAKRI